jgi:threonylcarbamoyladenosine tRNA methylthiotransferase MtaB
MGLNSGAPGLLKDPCKPAPAKNIAFKSIGCRTNQEEAQALSWRLAELGFGFVDKIDNADIIVVNTCSVTADAESKTVRFLHAAAKAAPNAGICITGCLAQQKPEELLTFPGVRWVVGNTRKADIPAIIASETGGMYWAPSASSGDASLKIAEEALSPSGLRTRFSIKIQEGCDNRCAYCIVPLLRGHSRSAAFSEIIGTCTKAVLAGFKEVVLTGTHIGQFTGAPGGGLAPLLKSLLAIPGDFRIRLSSLDPRDLCEELIELVGTDPKVCKHLHISVQSLSKPVVAAMGRGGEYFESLEKRLAAFRKSAPEAGIGGDFIVGFPGETESMFEETSAAAAAMGFSYGHVFRYSKRAGTAAASFPLQIPEIEKNRRSVILRDVLTAGNRAFTDRLTGTRHRIIVEANAPAVQGVASNYLRMEVPGAIARKNSWLTVTLLSGRGQNNCCLATAAA